VLISLPGIGRSIDSIVVEACTKLGIERWGGQSEDGWSRHSDFLRCPYRYYLKHVRGVGPLVVGEAAKGLDVGTCMHLLLAAHYARQLPDERYPGWQPNMPTPQALLQAMITAGLPMQIASDVEWLFDGYVEYYGSENITPMAIEMPIGMPGVHTSRLDLVFFIEDGTHDGLWICDHKNVSPKKDLEEYRFDGEILGEVFSWQLSGLNDFFDARLNGVCINAVVKSKPPRFQRLWCTFPDPLINVYANDRAWWAKQIVACQASSTWPKSMYGCHSYFRACRFWEHCRTQDEGRLIPLEQDHA
jgi:hypothetical protein